MTTRLNVANPHYAAGQDGEQALGDLPGRLGFYLLFWAFFSGSFTGVVFETLYTMIRTSQFENRSGLVLGPFNLVYGLGALCLTAVLYRLRNRNIFALLLSGMLIGGLVEIICSYVQENVFGSISWNYVSQPFNVAGRTSLLLSYYWGVMAVIWIRAVFPAIARGLEKIPTRLLKPLTWILFCFMVLNIALSGAAVWRWSERRRGEPADHAAEALLDEFYPDARMGASTPTSSFSADMRPPSPSDSAAGRFSRMFRLRESGRGDCAAA